MNYKNIYIKLGLLVFLLAAVTFLSPLAARAIPVNDINNIATNNGLPNYGTFQDIFIKIIEALLGIVFILAVAFVVISGYRFITSAGNEETVTKAKQNLTWAIAGLVIVLLSWVIMAAIQQTLV